MKFNYLAAGLREALEQMNEKQIFNFFYSVNVSYILLRQEFITQNNDKGDVR